MEGQRFRNAAAASHLPLAFLCYWGSFSKGNTASNKEGGLCFPAMCLTYLNSLLWIYIGLGFCSTYYVSFLGMPAPGIENNTQNTEVFNL